MRTLRPSGFIEILRIGALAGIAGGVAEIGWIVFYGTVTASPTASVARGIVASVLPDLAASAAAPWLGIVIHLGLAVGLGLVLALTTRFLAHSDGAQSLEFVFVVLALVSVWGVNFLVALPYINPQFVHVLPYSVTLFSKLLFGLSAATVFRLDRIRRAPICRR